MSLPDAAFLFELADAAARETLPRFRQPLVIDNKPKEGFRFDPVTEADREAERAIRRLIEARYPEHAILGEEFGRSGEGDHLWVIDPVDGTRPFICGVPVWGTLIGLTVRGRAEIGIMSQPYTGERFYATAEGAFGEGPHTGRTPLKVRDVGDLSGATLFSSAPELFRGAMQERFASLVDAVRLTRFGADCYAFAMLASGHVDLCVEPGLQPYDIVALTPLVERAGGVITTFSGDRPEDGGDVIAAATPRLHEEALRLLNG
ncbi:histidinol-phosphatase [Aureimonas jatrophae]|uniref:Histidinol-phosphatase n=1 Tax=Aureimonas jatrophae TaxID=1166073 RepID=A0A1H0II77_9HYPH|nr:histidinol-phosphatase [Aureimonas jatrophae]MBB3952182.1 histidinol phosphatase-like enzyme (inositol monophosphatase family) [Aureimonas jatrophae]SDO30980.1 histidinol-phosphatase, inositol monophosphatase family [Aureimonas jatrophae]